MASHSKSAAADYDLLIIGGGVNGAGIARDAAGRGYSVCLCEKGDFGGGTSSASTKLFHGGLRYLEYFEIRLVREALIEREVLWQAMPHISWPMRFVLPYHGDMRFEGETSVSKLLGVIAPWLKGKRPAWMIRFGLFLYDHLGGRKRLPATRTLDLAHDPAGLPLKPVFTRAYEYSDCWVEDARLVVLNLRDAAERGAEVNPRTAVTRAQYRDGLWHAELKDASGNTREVTATMAINAAGPWVDEVLRGVFGQNDAANVRLVRGSHIVIKRKYDHDRCYFFQNADSRIIFAIPFEHDYTLIGTTDADHPDVTVRPEISSEECDYLCRMASAYFAEPVRQEDIVWTYSGVRPLFDDGAGSAQSATREYVLRREAEPGNGTLVNVFGGKITTYRRLAEAMLEKVGETLGVRGKPWTAGVPLPGGDFPVDGFEALVTGMQRQYPFMETDVVRRLCRLYGTQVATILGTAKKASDLGRHFGHGLYQAEAEYLIENEWAQTADDILFRRTKTGIRLSASQKAELGRWIQERCSADKRQRNTVARSKAR